MSANGHLQRNELTRIFHPSLVLYLATDHGAAAGWNAMRFYFLQRFGKDIYAEGPQGAYRDYATQVYFKQIYGSNAATPGQSNHGLGHAVDVAAPDPMATLIEQHGAPFGWGKTDAMWENWHVNLIGAYHRPNVGISRTYPVLTIGSGGLGLDRLVRALHRHLQGRGFKTDGHDEFGHITLHSLNLFQHAHGLHASGVTTPRTWQLLRS